MSECKPLPSILRFTFDSCSAAAQTATKDAVGGGGSVVSGGLEDWARLLLPPLSFSRSERRLS